MSHRQKRSILIGSNPIRILDMVRVKTSASQPLGLERFKSLTPTTKTKTPVALPQGLLFLVRVTGLEPACLFGIGT